MKRIVLSVVCALAACQALAFGAWLELVPYGGIETGGPGAVDRAALEAKFDELERTYANEPTIVWRTKALAYLFDHVRLGVNTNDLFVHWHADSRIFFEAPRGLPQVCARTPLCGTRQRR